MKKKTWERRGEYGLEIWEREDDEENDGEDAGWYSVATVHWPGGDNARLIAAAPQLLEALEATAEATSRRCEAHHLPLELDPQGDAHYPLVGVYHKIGTSYQACDLSAEELTTLPKARAAIQAAKETS